MIKLTDIEKGDLKEEENVKYTSSNAEEIPRNESQRICSQTNREKECHQHTQTHTYEINRQRGGADRHSTSAAAYAELFSDKRVRLRFLKKVYCVVSLMLLFSFGIILLCCLCGPISFFLQKNAWFFFVCLVIYGVSFMALACGKLYKKPRINIILLIIMMCSMGLWVSCLTVQFSFEEVYIAMATTLLITVLISLVSWLCPIDVTSYACCFFLAMFAISTFCTIGLVVNAFVYKLQIMHTVLSGILTGVFIMYLIYDTQAILNGRGGEIGPEDYLLGAIHLYIDIMYIFIHLLEARR